MHGTNLPCDPCLTSKAHTSKGLPALEPCRHLPGCLFHQLSKPALAAAVVAAFLAAGARVACVLAALAV